MWVKIPILLPGSGCVLSNVVHSVLWKYEGMWKYHCQKPTDIYFFLELGNYIVHLVFNFSELLKAKDEFLPCETLALFQQVQVKAQPVKGFWHGYRSVKAW